MSERKTLYGILFMVLAMQVVTVGDATAKWLTQEFSPYQIGWMRTAFQALAIAPFVLWKYRAGMTKELLKPAHILRGFLWAVAVMGFYVAIQTNPIPDALSLLFIAPLVVAALATVTLGEKFSLLRAAAIVVGFAGVLIVLRPGGGPYTPQMGLALLAGFGYGGYLLTTRLATTRLHPIPTTFLAALWATILSTPLAAVSWSTPDPQAFGLMVLVGVITALGQYLIALAMWFAKASVVAPFHYTEIVGATLVSWLVFGTFPTVWVFVGMGVVVASGLYLIFLETRKKNNIGGQDTA